MPIAPARHLTVLALLTALFAAPASAQDPETDAPPIATTVIGAPAPPPFITPATRNQKTAAVPLKLASGGKALLPIILSPDASKATRDIAADLARTLEKMTGAPFPVETGDGSQGIVLGTVAGFPHPELEDALKPILGANDVEAFAIRTSPGRLLLIGKTELGAGNAAYRFLQELGCRWLSPAPNWEVIPAKPELTWNRDITDRPDILGRHIWYAYPGKEYALWRLRNNHNSGLSVSAGHAYDQVINANQAAFDAHPEYYPLIGGERKTTSDKLTHAAFNASIQPDIGNPEVRKMFLEHARAAFRKNPEAQMVSMEPNDGGAYSSSPEFQKLGTVSDAVFGLANEVARMLQKEFPGKMVGVLAYREHADPPSFPLEPNIYVQITGALFSNKTREELLAEWAKKVSNIGFYDYYQPYEWNLDQLPGGTSSSYRAVANRIREQVGMKASSIDGQGSGSWFLNGRAYWVGVRLMWNSSQDPEALNTEYLQTAFGPAAETMGHFYELWIPDNKPIVSKNLVYQIALDVQKADEQAAGNPAVLARLNDIKQYLRFLELDWKLQALGNEGPYETREAAFVALFKHIWRSQGSKMNEVALAQQNLFQQRGEKSGIIQVNGPSNKVLVNLKLSPRDKDNPWKVDTPYTPEEIAANWQETLAYFKSPVIEEKSYSTDLVPVAWQAPQAPGVNATTDSLLQVQGTRMNWAMYSFKGEPLRPVLLSMSGRDMSWSLRDRDGKVVREGTVQKAEAGTPDAPTEIPVPRAGAYFLETGPANFTMVKVAPTAPASIVLKRGATISPQGPTHFHQPRCFYVPKGTQNIVLFTGGTPPKPAKLTAPDGAVTDLTGFREWSVVPVPAGQDGRVWSIRAGLQSLYIANAPPYVAPSPDRLLVPRDLAIKDGLTVRTN